MVEKFSSELTWEGVKIKVSCICEWPINTFCHIEIRADGYIPITETGYRSHFMLLKYLDEYDSYEAFVLEWLNDAAQSKEWLAKVEHARQGILFDL
jgi:hypothetical protein